MTNSSSDRFYLTTPIYYVNDKPHIGHAYTTIAADVLTRYFSKKGLKTFFLTGVDEHGQKVAKAAEQAGIAPKAHCDIMVERFKKLWKLLGINNSAFIRTTDEEHQKIVQHFLSSLYEKGLIVKRNFEGWYCTPCERYWTEKDLIERTCPDCRREVERFTEPDYYFLMTKFAEKLRRVISEEIVEIIPKFRKNEVISFIDSGIEDLCISRPKHRLSWGIPLPFDNEFVTYVWFDALINYYSGPKYLSNQSEEWWPADLHFIGKDILTTHSVYWLTMLMAMELPLPKRIAAHGWWKCGGEKMSKSLGNVVDPVKLVEEYSSNGSRSAVDAFRYFLMSEVSFGQDGSFTLEAFERRWTSDLSNDIGNLLRRVTSLVTKLLDGKVESYLEESDRRVIEEYSKNMETFQFSRAIEIVLAYVRNINQYVQDKAPWGRPADLDRILGKSAGALRLVSVFLYPFIPPSANLIANALGDEQVIDITKVFEKKMIEVKDIGQLFSRPLRKEEEKVNEVELSSAPRCSIDDVKKLGLKVGIIISAERVEKTKKLLKLVVDIGTDKRTLIAGIAESYEPESLIGKQVVVVTNLQPVKIRGIESNGMILAASDSSIVSLIAPYEKVNAGSEVK